MEDIIIGKFTLTCFGSNNKIHLTALKKLIVTFLIGDFLFLIR